MNGKPNAVCTCMQCVHVMCYNMGDSEDIVLSEISQSHKK